MRDLTNIPSVELQPLPVPDASLGLVPPDVPAVQVMTNDKTVTHSVCKTDIVMPGKMLEDATRDRTPIYCPECRGSFGVETFSTDRRAR